MLSTLQRKLGLARNISSEVWGGGEGKFMLMESNFTYAIYMISSLRTDTLLHFTLHFLSMGTSFYLYVIPLTNEVLGGMLESAGGRSVRRSVG